MDFGSRLKSNSRWIKFIFGFILLFLAGQTGDYLARPNGSNALVSYLSAVPASRLINALTPAEATTVRDITIRGRNLSITIGVGCEGTEGMILILAAVLAFPVRFGYKIPAVVLGGLVIYVSNLFRIILLFYTLRYKPGLFNIMHIYVGQAYSILIGFLVFTFWATRVAHHGKNN